MSGTRKMTVHDVAARAHVSAQTVSRVVNGSPHVSAAMRALVQRAVDELGYVPDPAARSLRTGRSRRIGVLTHQLTATGPIGNTAAALAELRAAGYELDVVPLPDDVGDDEGAAVRAVREAMSGFSRTACSVMALAQTERIRDAVLAVDMGLPVYVDEHLGRGTVDRPGAEDLVGRAAAGHLVALGHRGVAHLPGPAGSLSGRYRAETFTEALAAHGVPCATWTPGDWSAGSGYRIATTADLTGVTAVFVCNDAMALGVLRALRERGVGVPGEVSVLGVDDLPESEHTSPSLSSVHHDTAAEGRLAARVLLADLTSGARPDPAEHLRVEVRARESTAAVGVARRRGDR
ncbi:LacI family DNA-binding transcriptional regulator [Quadrisphaera setariae]|uniref:LacI family transcriptional regulator n=1 Tax=Quadrisphaera setariae TaxID=2593304 RepID=A0A5C8ZI03_9ACTN|nr:LacI family DNA-binding transcriptional regulator [Quadrisphaera setariae]TXR56779.1 LacI family transcriptional regulator [Quadrisphaera setariae]